MNNFEKIKAMDIDDMAEFLNNFRRIPKCDYCIYKNDYDDCHADFCYKSTKPWLESEVRE